MYYRPEVKTADADGISMDYFVFGEGRKAFVMLPGLSLGRITVSAQSVASAYREFGGEYTVYVFEKKNEIKEGYSIKEMTDDTAKVMKRIGISDAYVFGVSQGGMIAQCLAAEYPGLVSRLFLASTVCRSTDSSEKIIGEWVSLASQGKTDELVKSFLENLYSDSFLEKYKDALIAMYKNTPFDELRRFCILASACMDFDASDKLEKISCPVMVVGAENDKVFDADEFRYLSEQTGGGLYLYNNYGHAVYDEAPDYKERIAEFFND